MPIALHLMTMNGAISEYHVVKRLETDFQKNLFMVTVLSYSNEVAYLAGGSTVQSLPVRVPADACTAPLNEVLHKWLVTDPSSPFIGGQVVLDMSDTLEAAKERAWSTVKVGRANAEAGGFTFDGSIFDADTKHITGAVVIAMMAKAAGTPYLETWTLFDNTERVLNADQVMALGAAFGGYVSEIYDTARQLRAQIDASVSIQDLALISWPVRTLDATAGLPGKTESL